VARAAAVALLALLAAVAPGTPAAGEPLRLEDVVRLHVQGVPAETIVERIRTSPVDFDLSPEILDELRIAGIPESIVAAALERQRELHPPASRPEPVEAPVPTGPTLRVRLDVPAAKGADRAPLRVPEHLPAHLVAQLGIEPDARVEDVAVWAACLTPTHVPDHWRSESPLGRDFVSMPRHRLLAFEAGAEPDGDGSLVLVLPATLDLALDPDVAARAPEPGHRVSFGIAVELGGRWYRATSVEHEPLLDAVAELTLELVPVEGDPAATKLAWKE